MNNLPNPYIPPGSTGAGPAFVPANSFPVANEFAVGLGPKITLPDKQPTSDEEKVQAWLLGPLKKLDGHGAFIAMTLSLLLYEKHLRVRKGIIGDFVDNSPAWALMKADFGLDEEQSRDFWRAWRNGLLHRGLPKFGKFTGGYVMSKDFPAALQVIDKQILINPWIFRDKVVALIESDGTLWADDDAYPLPDISSSPDDV